MTVWNQHGRQVYYFQVYKPTPVWVWVLVGLGVLAVIVGVGVVCFVYPGVATKGSRGLRGETRRSGRPQVARSQGIELCTQATPAETRTPMLEESET